jgi:hypothetical protein
MAGECAAAIGGQEDSDVCTSVWPTNSLQPVLLNFASSAQDNHHDHPAFTYSSFESSETGNDGVSIVGIDTVHSAIAQIWTVFQGLCI